MLTPRLEQKVLSLYGMGNSYSDISQHLSEMYGYIGLTLSGRQQVLGGPPLRHPYGRE